MMLGMLEHNQAVEHWLVHSKDESLRPGVTRFSLPSMGTSVEQQEYVLNAIAWVAKHGWKFMHVYCCNQRTGEWRHKSRPGAPLGKKDRRWLSHYDPFRSKETSHGDRSALNYDQALENANALLKMVLKDQSSLSQALKMTEEVEEKILRWYVFPKEVAAFVQKGVEDVPGTFDKNLLVGAMRPISWFGGETIEIPPQQQTQVETDDAPRRFKDREHTGDAPMHEIIEGYEDGELSDLCQIFNPNMDEWELLVDYMKSQKQPSPAPTVSTTSSTNKSLDVDVKEDATDASSDANENTVEDSTTDLLIGTSSSAGDTDLANEFSIEKDTTATKQSIPSIEELTNVPVVEKREKKKPSRDSTNWGQGVKMSLQPQEEGSSNVSRRKGSRHVKPPPKLMRLVTQGLIHWDMIEEGDRLLLGLSGGKDSLSLLHILLEFKKKLPINFDIEVCTIDPMTPSFDPSPLIPYVESLGLKYHYIRDEIVERAMKSGKDGEVVKSLCAFCARMKRGNLYTCARKNNCNKLVLAQHLDDLSESFMMSVMHNGFLRTMKANYKINAGDLSVIRPLVYVRESLMTEFAKSANLPIINENCPACFEEPKERDRIKKMLAREETLYPSFFDNIKRSMMPLMHDDVTAILRSYTEEALAKSRKENRKKGPKKQPSQETTVVAEEGRTNPDTAMRLQDCSDEELVRELARRRAEKFRLAGASPQDKRGDLPVDPTGQVCSLNGGDGSIPCRELME